MAIMDHNTWMSETKRGIFTPRSAKLVVIDRALEQYQKAKSPGNLQSLKGALDEWIRLKGANWKSSTRNRNGTVERLLQEITAELTPAQSQGPLAVMKGSYKLENIVDSLNQEIVVNAMDTVKQAITRAQWAASLAVHQQKERQRLEKWFGIGVKPNDIKNVYGKVFQGIAGGAHLIRDDDPAEADTYAYVKLDDPKPPPRIYLCGAFWGRGRIVWTLQGGGWSKKDRRMSNDNPLGVVIHELTHLFAGTDDHAYGRQASQQLASGGAADMARARMNADNFEYFCEDVFLNLY